MARSKHQSHATKSWLQLAKKVSDQLRQTTELREYQRDEFVGVIRATKISGATQQEIANATGYSRQRIAQFLSEKRGPK